MPEVEDTHVNYTISDISDSESRIVSEESDSSSGLSKEVSEVDESSNFFSVQDGEISEHSGNKVGESDSWQIFSNIDRLGYYNTLSGILSTKHDGTCFNFNIIPSDI